jgi:peptidoglycan/xylan/chitin deacetylase (PgdA/CDA1 family)
MNVRQLVKSSFYSLQRRAGRLRAGRAPDGSADRAVVFVLHAISEARSDMAISPARFREQMEALLEAGYRALSVDDLIEATAAGRLSYPGFVVTFDDGYENVLTEAMPILTDLGIPATVFLATDFIDGKIAPPWRSSDAALIDEYRRQAALFRPMSWDQARELAHHPLFRIGNHTRSHPLLGTLPAEEIRREIADSHSRIAGQTGVAPTLFAYPFGVRRYGAYSDITETVLQEAGYRCSFTSEISRARTAGSSWAMPRMSLTTADTGADAVAKAAGAYDWVGWAQSAYQNLFASPFKTGNGE